MKEMNVCKEWWTEFNENTLIRPRTGLFGGYLLSNMLDICICRVRDKGSGERWKMMK